MSIPIKLASVTINASDTTITVNSPTGNDYSEVQSGWEIFIDGAGNLPFTLTGGGADTLTIAADDAPTTTLTARTAKIVKTKSLSSTLADLLSAGIAALQAVAAKFKVNADADSAVLRDNNGCVYAANATQNGHAVNKGQLGAAAYLESYKDYGIGAVKVLASGSSLLDTTLKNGLYYIPSATDTPSASTANWLILVTATNNSLYRTVKAWSVGKLGSAYGEFTNTYENGVWGGWRRVYDSGNTNFNTFGKVNAGRVIARGTANTTTTARFEFNIVSKTVPTDIDLTAVTDFEVRTISGGVVGTVSAMSLLSISSERVALVEVTITGGTFTVDQPVHLRNLNTNGLEVLF